MNEGSAARVAVTGLGAVTPLGAGASVTFANLVAGHSGIGLPTELGADLPQTPVVAEIRGLRVSDVAPAGLAAIHTRADALALLAAGEAIERAHAAGVELALALGTTAGGVREATPWLMESGSKRTNPALSQRLVGYPLHATAERLTSRFDNLGFGATYCSACSSSATAIARAANWISSGRCQAALAGGTEALSLLTLTGFAALGAMSRDACRPFDACRSGMTLGEAAAFLVLESEAHARKRGAEILAWLDAWSLGAEGHHITQPEPSGGTAARLIREALRSAGIAAEAVGYYNAHGTGTVPNDSMEAGALRAAFGAAVDRVYVSSAKGQLGHTLGAAGALEALVTVLALRDQLAPPTVGLVTPAPDTALNHVIGTSRPLRTDYALSGSFGFGGLDVILLFSHLDTRCSRSAQPAQQVVISAAVDDSKGSVEPIAQGGESQSDPPDPLSLLDPDRSRRFDRLSALTCAGVERLMAVAPSKSLRTGLVVGNALGNTQRLSVNLARIGARGPRGMAPAEFPHLVHSSVAGNASIYCSLSGPVTTLSDSGLCCGEAIEFAAAMVEHGLAEAMIAGVVEALDDGSESIVDPYASAGHSAAAKRDLSHWFLLETRAGALQRRRPILARVLDAAWPRPTWYQYLAEREPPLRGGLILDGVDAGALDLVTAIRQWRGVPRWLVNLPQVPPSGTSSVALLKAIDVLTSESLAEVLVVSKSGRRTWVIRLAAPDPVGDGDRPNGLV